MTFRVELALAAMEQTSTAASWWRANRPAASNLFDVELADALDLLATMPTVAQIWGDAHGTTVRRIRMPRTRHALYFTIDGDLVTVHALWHGARGSGPPLP